MTSTGTSEGPEPAPVLLGTPQGSKGRRPVHRASIALVLGLFVLSTFSVTVAVTNHQAAKRAQRSADTAALSQVALEALVDEEDAADDVIAGNDAESRYRHAAARVAAARALDALGSADGVSGTAYDGRDLLTLHASYTAAVAQMIGRYAGGPLALAEVFEEARVDPFFDPLAEALNEARNTNDAAAQDALSSIGRSQRLLLVATPLLFGATLALITLYVVKLGQSRSEVARQAERNSYQSLHDGLTGLPNRTLLGRSSAVAVARAAGNGTQMALMVLDLDRFKEINDTLGHHAGDLVLEAVASRLRRAVRSTDTVARLGGDEFAILLPHVVDVDAAVRVATKVQAALTDSIEADGVALEVDASIGIALSGDHGADVASLLKHADIAMYRAKGLDQGICVYDAGQNDHSRQQLGLLGELRRAIDNQELVLHFQPKVTLNNGDFFGVEALVRWNHPTKGMVPPGAFIPAAERTALIRPLTRYVIDAALAECQRWQHDGKDLVVAVNISARNLLDANFPADVADLLEKWGLPASCLVFEVTESAVMVEAERSTAMLNRFSALGIELSIDDFGAGYTSLAHLRTLTVQELKIDQALVMQMSVSARDALIVRAVIDLAHDLGLRTVAEGIEDAHTLDRLTLMGCDIGQGFHIARPMTGDQLSRWWAERHAPLAAPWSRA